MRWFTTLFGPQFQHKSGQVFQSIVLCPHTHTKTPSALAPGRLLAGGAIDVNKQQPRQEWGGGRNGRTGMEGILVPSSNNILDHLQQQQLVLLCCCCDLRGR